jgi:hypothetical protein
VALLDDPDVRERLITSLSRRTLEAAATEIGISRRAVSKYADKHPEFAARIDAARGRREAAVASLPGAAKAQAKARRERPPPEPERQAQTAAALAVPVELVEDADRDIGPTAEELIELCWLIAQDPEHRGCAKALHILAEYKLGPLVRAQQRAEARAAERDATTGEAELVIVRVPANGTESPDTVIVDAELVGVA